MQRETNLRKSFAVAGATAAAMLLCLLVGSNAGAQKLPSKITWIVPFGLGGGTGTSALLLAPKLQKKLEGNGVKEVKVVSVPGAGGTVGTKKLYGSPADGSVIGSMLPAGGLAQSSIRDVGFDLSKFTYLAKITTAPRFLFVKGDSPIKTLDALIAEGKKRPLKVSSVGPASAGSFVLANIIDKTGIQVKDVTGYKSGRTLVVAVARGDVDTTIKTTGGVVTFIKSGEVRGLVQLSSEKDKDPFFPDVPSAEALGRKDLMPGGILYILVAAPPKVPQAVADVLSNAVHAVIMESKAELESKAQVIHSPGTGKETAMLVNNLIKDYGNLIALYKAQQKK